MDGDQGAERARALTRRSLITAGAGAAVALGGSRWLGLPSPAPAAPPRPYAKPLRIPREIRSGSITLTAQRGEARILPGRPTEVWGYAGEFPGPTIRRPSGGATNVDFRHRLPKSAGQLTLHLHGGHNSEADDGQPGAMSGRSPAAAFCRITAPGASDGYDANAYLVAPGRSRTYSYEATEDGRPERPATQWYHDHRCGETARNIWRGLHGMWIVDAPADRDEDLGIPTGARDVPLIIGDRSFDRRNQLTNPFGSFASPPQDSTVGRKVLVNGRIAPHHDVDPTTYRFRVLNASLFQSYNLALSEGISFTLIATEAGLLTAPRQLDRLLLGPGERAEIIVDFSSLAGRSLVLSSALRVPPPESSGFGSQSYKGPLLQFRVSTRSVPAPTAVAPVLSALPEWTEDVSPDAAPDVTWRLGTGFRTWTFAAIEPGEDPRKPGKPFDPGRVDYTAALDTTQVWRLSNPTPSAHLVHLHHTDWYILRRERIRSDGTYETTEPEPLDGLKETFFLDPDESIVVAGRLSDHRGRFIVHCHMLDHEDHGLMATFEVV